MTGTASQTTTIEKTVRIAASPETLWEFWTDPERIAEWWGTASEIETKPGGLYRVVMDGGPIMRGAFVELDRPHRLVFTFGWEQNTLNGEVGPGSTRVEVTLTPDGGETVLVLRHFDLPETHAADHEKGWTTYVGERLPAAVSA